MNRIENYFWGLVGITCVVLFCWYFSAIIAYILIAAVVSFLGRPIVRLLGKVRFHGRELHDGVKAGLTLTAIWAVFILLIATIIPAITHEVEEIGTMTVDGVVSKLDGPINDFTNTLREYGFIDQDREVSEYLTEGLRSFVSVTKIRTFFGSLAGTISDIFVALFSITFISFFFLKESKLFNSIVIALFPAKYEEGVRNALDSIRNLLTRYLGGIVVEVIGVMLLNTLGLWIIGFRFSNAILIGLISGVLNIVPYIGPLIAIVLGVLGGIGLNSDLPFYTDLLPLLSYMVIVMLLTQLIDNLVFQPLIYGNSVYAHPLEIFLVILMAGTIAGIPGMVLAIPAYTVLRVILREFFSKYRLVKKITGRLE